MKRFSICTFLFLCWTGVMWGQTQTLSQITGMGHTGTLARFTSSTTIGSSGLFQFPNGNTGVGTNVPGARLDILSNFGGGGPTVIVENAAPGGDDAVDFLSA